MPQSGAQTAERGSGGVADGGSNVVFLLSSPRAGSTLLSAILNRHSKVLCPAEPWFLLSLHGLYYGSGTALAAYDQRLADIGLRELASEQEFLAAARAFAASVYGARLAASGRSVFVDKTPRYYHVLPFLSALFPRAKAIWLKRNPLDVAASFKSSWGVSVAELVGRELSPNSFDLTVGLADLGAWFDGRPGRLEISYEELVAEPDAVVDRILEFLALDAEPRLSEYGVDEASMGSFRRSSLGDRKVLDHSRPHGRSVGTWKDAFLPTELAELVAGIGTDSFGRMGYADELRDASKRAGTRLDPELEAPRHLEKLRLYRKWFAAAIPAGRAEPGVASSGTEAPSGTRDLRIASLEAQLAVSEADREARLAVIERQGADLGRIPGLQAERDDLVVRLAASEADREARLAVIQKQGAELGQIPGLEEARRALAVERDSLVAERDAARADRDGLNQESQALRSIVDEIGRRVESAGPKTRLGIAPPSEVRRLRDLLSTIETLVHVGRRGGPS